MTATVPPVLPLRDGLQQAIVHHKAGRLQEAELLYRAILQAQPLHPDANHNLGVLAGQLGQYEAALPYLKTALAINPAHGQYALSYAQALLATGRAGDALNILQAAMRRGLNTPAAHALRKKAEAAAQGAHAMDGSGRPDRAAPPQAECDQLITLYNAERYMELETRARALVDQYPDSGFAWKLYGAALQLQGKEALPALQTAMELLPGDADALNNLGNALLALGRFDDAAARYRRALEIKPDFAEAHANLGNALKNHGQLNEAVASCRRALEIKPDFADAHAILGATLQDLGRFDDAIAGCRRALEIKPDFAEAHNILGNILRDNGQLDDAVKSYRQALRVEPDFADAHYNLGSVLRDLGELDDAVASCRRALEIKPDLAEAHSNLGLALRDLGRLEEAVASCRRALEIKPALAQAHFNLGLALQALGHFDAAEASYRRAVEIKPDLGVAHCNRGAVLRIKGNYREARACYRKAQELGFGGGWIRDALMLPAMMGTREEVLESRAEFERRLDQLVARAVPCNDPLVDVGETNFYLAYQGLNDRDLQVKVAKYYERACPSLLYVAPHCIKPGSGTSSKIRIGFFSSFLYTHSVSLCYSNIIEALSVKESFDVTLISERAIDEAIYSRFAGHRVRVPFNLARAREMIAGLELDILVYLDIGMEPLSYFLAFSRLARVQCVLGGHPVTTGIGNLDYFLSAELTEPPDADAHYSERLIRSPRPLFYFTRPTLPATFKTRRELGLPEGRHIYMCPLRLQKMHPDFDEAIARVLQLDGNGVVVLFEDILLPFGKKILQERFEKTIPSEVRERIVFLPWLRNPADFASAIAAADVILDSFHFGLGTTAMVSFATGVPLVTKPGKFMRGRVGMGLCRMLDVPECIAEDTESYAQKAVQIASTPSLRDAIGAKARKNSHVLYENLQPVDDLADLFRSLSDRLAKQP